MKKTFSVPNPTVYLQTVRANDQDRRLRNERRIRNFVELVNTYDKVLAPRSSEHEGSES